MDYRHKVTPYRHQAWVFEQTRDEPGWGLFLQQRLGKSKVLVDTAAWLYGRGEVNALVVVAPNGVHRAWVYGDESAGDHPDGHVGDHCPDHVPYRCAHWRSAMRKRERDRFKAIEDPNFRGLRVLAINVEALGQDKRGRYSKAADYLRWFLRTFNCLLAVDESTCVKNADGKRAGVVIDLAPLAPYRRLLTGEPNPEGPTDLWGQLMVLEDAPLGFTSYYAFRARYCKLEKRVFAHPKKPGQKIKTQVVTGFMRQDELATKLATVSTTLKREDCGDMPEQVFANRYVELSAEQLKAYRSLADEWYYALGAGDEELSEVDVERALTRMIRFNQVCGGFLPDENGDAYAFASNPKLEALMAELEQFDAERKVIIWAHFKPELRAIERRLAEAYGWDSLARYHGDVPDDERDEGKARFQRDPTCRFFVGNPQAGRYNLTLAAANDVIWYSWDHPLETYIQANDRPVLPNKRETISYLHLLVPGTFEAEVLGALRRKQHVADSIRHPVRLRELLKGGT